MWDPTRRSAHREDALVKELEERVNDHNALWYNKKSPPSDRVAAREFMTRAVWRKKGDGFIFVTSPDEKKRGPEELCAGLGLRSRFPSAMNIKRKSDKETAIEYVVHADTGGRSYLSKELGLVTEIEEYFQSLRGLDQWGAGDGRAVGEILCIETMSEKHHRRNGEIRQSARIRELVSRYKGLRDITRKYEFWQPMLVRVVENKLRTPGDVKSKLCGLSERDGRTIGGGLSSALYVNLTAETGVDEWISKYRALRELDKEEAWFRPMMNVVAERLLGEVSWGLKMRVTIGAGLSVLDLATDVFVIWSYIRKEDTQHYGWILFAMIMGSILLQLLMSFAQHRKKKRDLARELLIVIVGMKPVTDCYNVVSGKKMEQHHVLDPKTELVGKRRGTSLATDADENLPSPLSRPTFTTPLSLSPLFTPLSPCSSMCMAHMCACDGCSHMCIVSHEVF